MSTLDFAVTALMAGKRPLLFEIYGLFISNSEVGDNNSDCNDNLDQFINDVPRIYHTETCDKFIKQKFGLKNILHYFLNKRGPPGNEDRRRGGQYIHFKTKYLTNRFVIILLTAVFVLLHNLCASSHYKDPSSPTNKPWFELFVSKALIKLNITANNFANLPCIVLPVNQSLTTYYFIALYSRKKSQRGSFLLN